MNYKTCALCSENLIKIANCDLVVLHYFLKDGLFVSGDCTEPETECSFEGKTTCMWKFDDTADYKWYVIQGENAGDFRPKIDHTTRSSSGWYLISDAYVHPTGGGIGNRLLLAQVIVPSIGLFSDRHL